jgi:CHAT domain-containing protein/tetratricopeptide (TPR) repeat protein
MPHSYAQTAELTCPACRQPFSADIWLIVDAAERPDLRERIRASSLHALPCPHCGHDGAVDAPLLVFRPNEDPPLMFLPMQNATAQQNSQQVNQLLTILKASIGAAWQDAWIAASDTLDWPLDDATVNAGQASPMPLPGDQEPPGEAIPPLLHTLDAFVRADTWLESQRIVEAYPELLSDEAQVWLGQLIAAAQAQNDANARAIFEEHRTLLQRCREIGIAAAFAEKTSAATSSPAGLPPELRRLLDTLPHDLQQILLQILREASTYEEFLAALNHYPELRADLMGNTPEQASETPPHFSNDIQVAQSAIQRYLHNGDQVELDTAVTVWQRMIDHPLFVQAPKSFQIAVLNEAGGVHLRRYWAQSLSTDLDTALHLWQAAVSASSINSPDLPAILNNLGNGLSTRYERIGRLEDLEEAIRCYQRAVSASPPDSPDLPSRLTNLGNGLSVRHGRVGRLEDLEEAIRCYQRAVSASPPDSPDLPAILTNLGNGLSARHGRIGHLEDLEEAVRCYQRAVSALPPDSPDLLGYLTNLGNGLLILYERVHRLEDLEDAIHSMKVSVMESPPNSPDLPMYLSNLGNSLRVLYERTGCLKDLEDAKLAYTRSCDQGLEVAPEVALRSACNWAGWALERYAWSEVITATARGRAALDQLFTVQIDRPAQESVLAQGHTLASQAAYALAQTGQLAEAVTAIEQGRARLLAETLQQNRTDLQRLPSLGHRPLYTRYQVLLDRRTALLQGAATTTADEVAAPYVSGLERLAQLEQLFAELQGVIGEIQQIPGYEDFFAKPTFAQIQTTVTATDGVNATAAVYLLTIEQAGLALIVHAGGVEPVWLNDLTDSVVREWLVGTADEPALGGWLGAYQSWLAANAEAARLRSQEARQRALAAHQAWFAMVAAITAQLWDHIMGPVAATLATLGFAPGGQQPPAVTLIPTGLLALLPLHAAWTERAGQSSDSITQSAELRTAYHYFLDDYAVRYAPSATALRHCQERLATVAPLQRLLAINEPQPVTGGGPLPNSGREVAAIADLFDQATLLAHEAAHRAAVLDALPAAQVAHFSCHGSNAWGQPLETGLLLAHDERLTVRDFLVAHLPAARLATLSACETGIVGTDLPDEVVTLPSALVQAGYAGVVASLWSVADVSTAMLMVRFYEYWRVAGLEPIYALRAAQHWVRDTTNREKQAHFRRSLSTHTGLRMSGEIAREFFYQLDGQAGDERTFDHPFWWAAFYLTGV